MCRSDFMFFSGSLLRSWVPLGKTQWIITSPVQSPALPGPRPAPHPRTPTMSKFLMFILIYAFTENYSAAFLFKSRSIKHSLTHCCRYGDSWRFLKLHCEPWILSFCDCCWCKEEGLFVELNEDKRTRRNLVLYYILYIISYIWECWVVTLVHREKKRCMSASISSRGSTTPPTISSG